MIKHARFFVLWASLVWLMISSAEAGTNAWTVSGPETGIIYNISADTANPCRLYVQTPYCVFYSDNQGVNWQRIQTLPRGWVYTFVVNQKTPSQIYAVMLNQANDSNSLAPYSVYSSSDHGVTWKLLIQTRVSSTIYDGALTVIPGSSADTLFLCTNSGINRSTDGGITWSPYNTGLPIMGSGPAWVKATPSGTLYTAVSSGTPAKVYKRTAGAPSWVIASPDVPASSYLLYPVTISSHDENILYFSVLDPPNIRTIYTSKNGGVTWSKLPASWPTEDVTGIVVDPSSPTTVYLTTGYGGVYRSTNSGTTWSVLTKSGLPHADYFTYFVSPTIADTLFAGGNGDLFRSVDGGLTWTSAMNGLVAASSIVEVLPGSPTTILAGTGSGKALYRSDDGGVTWNNSSQGLPEFISLNVLTSSAQNPSVVFAGYNTASGIARSTDAGRTWQQLTTGLPSTYVFATAIAVAPSLPSTIYYATFNNVGGNALYKSVNGGDSWVALTPNGLSNPPNKLTIDASDPNKVYAASYSKDIYRSSDGGNTWNVIFKASDTTNESPFLVVNKDTHALYAGSGTFLNQFLSGAWSIVHQFPGTESILDLVVDPANSSTLYILRTSDIYRSIDGGSTWDKLSYPGLGNTQLTALAIDFANYRLYAGTKGAGVYWLREGPPVRGDANGDDTINVFDALLALQNAVGLYHPSDETAFRTVVDVAPLDASGKPKGDGKVDVFDALAILRHAVGLDAW